MDDNQLQTLKLTLLGVVFKYGLIFELKIAGRFRLIDMPIACIFAKAYELKPVIIQLQNHQNTQNILVTTTVPSM